MPVLELDDTADEAGWIEFRIGDAVVMAFGRDDDASRAEAPTHAPWVFVDDVDAHFARVRTAGATIVTEIQQHGYRAYEAEDVEGYRWTFAQARPTMSPERKVT